RTDRWSRPKRVGGSVGRPLFSLITLVSHGASWKGRAMRFLELAKQLQAARDHDREKSEQSEKSRPDIGQMNPATPTKLPDPAEAMHAERTGGADGTAAGAAC